MVGSVSQPDVCLYVSVVQALKAHQTPRPAEAAPGSALEVVPPPARGRLLPAWGWLARLGVPGARG